jgi:uncharacterized protein with GYD domain
MPTYVTLVNFTDAGRASVEELPENIERMKLLKRSLGGEPKGFFFTLGQYDLVAVSEMPDDESVAQIELTAAMEGDVDLEVLRAFSMDEVRDVLRDLPA